MFFVLFVVVWQSVSLLIVVSCTNTQHRAPSFFHYLTYFITWYSYRQGFHSSFKVSEYFTSFFWPWMSLKQVKSSNFIFEVSEIWSCRNVLTNRVYTLILLTPIRYFSLNDTIGLPYVIFCKQSAILEFEHCYLLWTWLSGFLFTVFHVLLIAADAV